MEIQQPGNSEGGPSPSSRGGRGQAARPTSEFRALEESLASATTADERIALLKGMLVQLGLHQDGLAKLSRDSFTKLFEVVRGEGRRSGLITKMFNAVAETAPHQVEKFVQIISTYRGQTGALEDFINNLGHNNPFIAAQRAQILILPAKENNVRSSTGFLLKGVTYIAYDPECPQTTLGYSSGKQAIVKIMSAWNPERFGDEPRGRVRDRRNSQLRKALREIDLESLSLSDAEVSPQAHSEGGLENVTVGDFEANPELQENARSRIIVRNLEVYRELRRAIDECKSHLAQLIYGGDVVLPGLNSLKVGQDPGRQFFGWFEEHFRENPNAPRGIWIAYQSLRDEDISLSPEEEADYLRGLLAYQRVHSYIDKETALGGLVSDLAEYDALAVNDDLRLNPAMERARQKLQVTIASTPPELSIAEFSSMLEDAAMVQFRQEMNKRILDRYRDEFDAALKLFEFVAVENGNWREDALGDSVPMERLRQHLYGARVGVEDRYHPNEKKRGALAQPDFRHVMDAQLLRTLVRAEDKLLNAKPIAEFREMVEGVVVAYRKAMFLEECLRQYATTPEGAAAVEILDRNNIGETLAAWKPVLPLGGAYKLAEKWYEETAEPKPTCRSLVGLAARIIERKSDFIPIKHRPSDRHEFGDKYASYAPKIEQFAKAGLYFSNPKMDALWRTIDEKVGSYVDVTEYQEIFDRAARVIVHPMVLNPFGLRSQTLAHRFVSPTELVAVQALVTLEVPLEEVCSGFNSAELAELQKRMKTPWSTVFTGTVSTHADGFGQLTLRDQSLSEFVGAIESDIQVHTNSWTKTSGTFCDPKRLQQALDVLESSYVSIDSLSRDWVKRARTICSWEGKQYLVRHGFKAVDTETYHAAKRISSSSSTRVSREFAEAIDRIFPPGEV